MKTTARFVPVVLLVGAGILAAAAPVAAKDLMLRKRTTASIDGKPAAPPRESVEYITDGQNVVDDPTTRILVDFSGSTYTLIEKEQKTYSVATFGEIRKLIPDGEAGAGANTSAEPGFEPTGKTGKIAGYEAREFALAAPPMRATVWTSEGLEKPRQMDEWRKLATNRGAPAGPGAVLAAAMADLTAVPLRLTLEVDVGERKMVTSTEVVEVSDAAPPAAMLRVPEGFKKVPSPLLKPPPSAAAPKKGPATHAP